MVTGETGIKPSEAPGHRHTHPAGQNVNKPQREKSSGCEPRKQEARSLHSLLPFYYFKNINTNNKRRRGKSYFLDELARQEEKTEKLIKTQRND